MFHWATPHVWAGALFFCLLSMQMRMEARRSLARTAAMEVYDGRLRRWCDAATLPIIPLIGIGFLVLPWPFALAAPVVLGLGATVLQRVWRWETWRTDNLAGWPLLGLMLFALLCMELFTRLIL